MAVGLLLAATTRTTARRAFYLGMLHGLASYGTALSWFFNIFGKAALPLFAILALFTGITCLAANAASKRHASAGAFVLAVATLWTGIEFVRCELYFLRFPWLTPGVALGPTHLSPLLGVYATSFLVVAAAAALVRKRSRGWGAGLTLGFLALGIIRPGAGEVVDGPLVTLVQCEDSALPAYLALTESARDVHPDLVVWPEYALPYDVRQDPPAMTKIVALCESMDITLVLGTKTVAGGESADWFNTALVLDRGGVVGEYYKTRPVHFFDDGTPGESFAPTGTELGRIGTPICFDGDYSEVIRKIVSQGAEFIVAPTFDAESWTAKQHEQHAALARIRAAETGRWFAAAASSGVTQFIDPGGNLRARLPLVRPGTLSYRVGRSSARTPFVAGGWLFPWVALAASGALAATGFLKRSSSQATAARSL